MTVLGVSTSYFIQHLVDSVLVRHEERLLNALGVGMVLVLLFRTLFGVLRQYLLAHVGRKVDLALIAGYARHLLGLPLRFFEMRRVGEILSRVNDAAKVREAISGTTTDGGRRRHAGRGPAGGAVALRRAAGAGGHGVRARCWW